LGPNIHPPKKRAVQKKPVKKIPFEKDTFLCFLMVFLGGIGGKPVVEEKRHPVAQFLSWKNRKKRKHLWSMICEGTTTR